MGTFGSIVFTNYLKHSGLLVSSEVRQLIDPTRNRLRATPATDAKKTLSQKKDDIIVQEVKAIWGKHPSCKPWRIAGGDLRRSEPTTGTPRDYCVRGSCSGNTPSVVV